jgi:acetyl esterase/lipase
MSEPNREFEVRRGLVYATHDGQPLGGDLYLPRGGGACPTLIGVHGGGWQQGDPSHYRHWGPWFAARGYGFFSVGYRLVKKDRRAYPEAVHDIRAAVQFTRANAAELRADPQRLGLFGSSAGAHLAALVALAGDHPDFLGRHADDAHATVSTRVKALVGIYGVYDMLRQWEWDQLNRPLDSITERFLGLAPMESRKLYFEASPLSYAVKANAATAVFLNWGTHDDIVEPAQSEVFLRALKQAGFFVRTCVIPGAGHFYGNDPVDEPGSYNAIVTPKLERFLADRL